MATWHPPIPNGKLYSEDALRLGPGIALLAWCYDHVQKGGTIEVSLEKAGRDIGKPYGTIRDWWRMLREGPFFCEQIDRGKRGWVVRMADDWLDWRVMANNYPDSVTAEMSALTERRNVSVEDVQSAVKAPSKQRHRRDVSVEPSAYKVLHDDQESLERGAQKRAPPSPHQQLMKAYQETLGYKIPNAPKEAAAAKRILDAGYTPEQAIEVYCSLKAQNFYSQKHLSLHTVYEQLGAVLNGKAQRNGTTHRQHSSRNTQSSAERTISREKDHDKPW